MVPHSYTDAQKENILLLHENRQTKLPGDTALGPTDVLEKLRLRQTALQTQNIA